MYKILGYLCIIGVETTIFIILKTFIIKKHVYTGGNCQHVIKKCLNMFLNIYTNISIYKI